MRATAVAVTGALPGARLRARRVRRAPLVRISTARFSKHPVVHASAGDDCQTIAGTPLIVGKAAATCVGQTVAAARQDSIDG